MESHLQISLFWAHEEMKRSPLLQGYRDWFQAEQ